MASQLPDNSTNPKLTHSDSHELKRDNPSSIYFTTFTKSQTKSKYSSIGFLLIPIFIILLIFLKINVFDNLSGGKNNHKKLKKYYKKLKLI